MKINTSSFSQHRLLLTSSGMALCCLTMMPSAALSQDATVERAEPQADTSAGGLDEIIVTARKREENAQDTPISITAMSGDMLEERQILNVAQIASFAPNVNIQPVGNVSGSSATITAFIRGIGQTDFNITADPGVGIYVDGVYVARSVGGLLDLADIGSVQILRGPQGTLFGKNTIGGAVVINTNQPSDEFELRLEGTTGRFNRADIRGLVNIPISDTLAVRAVASYETRDGYQRRLFDGGRQGNKDSFSGRLALKWEPTDSFSAILAGDVNIRREEQAAIYLVENRDSPDLLQIVTTPNGTVAFPSSNFGFNKLGGGAGQCGAPGELAPIDNPNCVSSRWVTGDIDTTWAGGPNQSDFDLWGTNLTLEYDFGNVSLKSISAYRDQKSIIEYDFDGTPFEVLQLTNNINVWQASQELQLIGNVFNDRLAFVLGGYYLKEKGDDIEPLRFGFAEFFSGGEINNDSFAGYLQFTYKATDKLSITPGIRYTDEVKRFDPSAQVITRDLTAGGVIPAYPDGVFVQFSRCIVGQPAPQLLPGGFPDPACVPSATNPTGRNILPAVEVSVVAKEWTPSLAISYQITEDILSYVSYSRGFKNGGFSQRIFPAELVTPEFRPEFVNSYEIGVKTELFDRRLRLNISAFQSDYSDIQIVVNEGISPQFRNGGEGRIRGFEIEGQAAPTDWLRIDYGVGFLDAFYRSVDPSAFPVNVDSQFAFVPQWTATIAPNIEAYSGDLGTLALRGSWAYQSSTFKDAVNSPQLFQPAYSLFNASASFTERSEHFTVTAGVTNLTNQRPILGGYVDLDVGGAATATFARPQEWFLRIAYKY